MKTETRHSITMIIGSVIVACISMVYTVYVARILGPVESAHFFTALSFALIFISVSAPINNTVTHFASMYATREEYAKITVLETVMVKFVQNISFFCVIIGIVCVRFLTEFFHFNSPWLLVAVYGVTICSFFLNVYRGILRGLHAYGAYNINTILEAVVRLGVGCVLVYYMPQAVWAVFAYCIAMFMAGIIFYAQMRSVRRVADNAMIDTAAITRFMVPMFVMSCLCGILLNIDMFFVKRYCTDIEAGCYGAALTLARSVNIFFMAFNTFLLPLLTERHERGRNINGGLVRVSMYFLVCAGALVWLFYVYANPLVRIVYGADFNLAGPLVLPLVCAMTCAFLGSFIAQAFAACHRFAFLIIYCIGLIAMICVLWCRHDSLRQIVQGVVLIQGVILMMLVILFCVSAYKKWGTHDIA